MWLACLAPASHAAAPAPDPPPFAVAPDAPQPAPAEPKQTPVEQRAPVVTPTVVTQAPVVTRTVITPGIVTREVPVRRAAAPAKTQAKPKPARKTPAKANVKPAQELAAVARAFPPHDRHQVPFARFVTSAEELNRGLVALASLALSVVALGGGVVLRVGHGAMKSKAA